MQSDNNEDILEAISNAPDLMQEDVEIKLGNSMQDEVEQADLVSTGCPFLVSLGSGQEFCDWRRFVAWSAGHTPDNQVHGYTPRLLMSRLPNYYFSTSLYECIQGW